MLRIMMILFAFSMLSLVGGCSDYDPSQSYDGSVGRQIRKIQAETYNMDSFIHGTGKAVEVPLF